MLKKTLRKALGFIQNRLNSLVNLMQFSILLLGIPNSLCAEKLANKFTRHKGSSKSLKSSTNL